MFAPVFLACLLAGKAIAADVVGAPRIADGDTLDIDGIKIRLLDIDAPEADQTCTDERGRTYLCGKDAIDALRRVIRGRNVVCTGTKRDRYDRLLAHCRIGRTDIGAEMIRRGWAVRFDPEGSRYLAEELDAAKAPRGIWRGAFTRPGEHRRARWAEAVAKDQGPKGCPIKGNISKRNGREVRIYHTPWSPWYDKTRINESKGERWFCDEAEAVRAGWRAPLR